jgi:anthranilate phosphoribosyltransferase
MSFTQYIKAVGTGPKHNHDLTKEQIEDALSLIFDSKVSNEEIGAFLLGWRVKGESIDEFIGALNTFDKYIKKVNISNSIELGYPYDGKADNPYLFPLIAKYLQPFDINLVLCFDSLTHAKKGITVKQICDNISLSSNIKSFDRQDIFPQLSKLNIIRENLAIRTSFNAIEKLTGFANSNVGILGVFHKPFVDKYLQCYKNRYKTFAVIKGNEGSFEIFSKTKVWIYKNDFLEELIIDPKDFGINYLKSWDRISDKQSILMTQNPSKELINLAKLNAALFLYIYDNKFDSIRTAYNHL